MSIPESVLKQAEEADRLLNELNSTPEPTAAPEQPEATPAPSHDDWESRYRTLQGKFNAEVRDVQQDNRALRAENADLRMQVRDLATRYQDMQAYIQSQQAAPPSLDFKKLQEDYGEDLAKVIQTQMSTIGSLQQEIQRLQQGQQQVVQQTMNNQESSFWNELRRIVPDWEQLNEDPRFLTWLKEPDGFSGQSRMTSLRTAQQRFDADQAATFFRAFKAGIAPKKPDLAQNVSPSTSQATPTKPAGDMPTFTRDQVKKIYDDYGRGVYKGREQEFERLDKEITKAYSEGRVM